MLGTIRWFLSALHPTFQPEGTPGTKYPAPPPRWLWKSPCEVQPSLPPLPGIWTCWVCSSLWPNWNDIRLLCPDQSVCLLPLLHSLPLYLQLLLSYYHQLFYSLHQNTSNFFLLLNMSILFSNTPELYTQYLIQGPWFQCWLQDRAMLSHLFEFCFLHSSGNFHFTRLHSHQPSCIWPYDCFPPRTEGTVTQPAGHT